ncbi:unnamed protein product, partial [Amoebophrya sp. A120]
PDAHKICLPKSAWKFWQNVDADASYPLEVCQWWDDKPTEPRGYFNAELLPLLEHGCAAHPLKFLRVVRAVLKNHVYNYLKKLASACDDDRID